VSFLSHSRNRSFQYRSVSIILAVFFVSALTVIVSGCGGTAERPTYDLGSGPITTKAKDPISQSAVEQIVTHKLGEAAAAGQPVIRQVTLTPEAGGVFVSIDLNRTSSCHPGALVGTAVTMAKNVMSALFLYPDVSKAQITLYGTTVDAANANKPAVRIMITKDSAAKVDWFQFSDTTVEKYSTEFWAEADIYANWKQYGGAAITDDAQKAAANSGAATTPATP